MKLEYTTRSLCRSSYSSTILLLTSLLCIRDVGAVLSISPAEGLKVRAGEEAVFTATLDSVPSTLTQDKLGWNVLGFKLIRFGDTRQQPNYNATWDQNTKTSTLIIHDVTLADDGNYMFQLIDGVNSQSSPPARLTVLVPPVRIYIEGGETQDVVEGVARNISCSTEGSNPAVTFNWLKDGSPVTVATHTTPGTAVSRLYTSVSVVTVNAVKADSGATYTCQATGDMMTSAEGMSASTSLNVQYVPKLSLSPERHSFDENTNAKFTCATDANPPAMAWSWFLNGVQLTGEDSSSLTLSTVAAEQNGKVVKCQATNSIGTSEADLTLTVHYAPRFIDISNHSEVDLGDSVTLKCQVDGNPPPTVFWRKVGSDRIITSPTVSGGAELTNIQDGDIGAYECIAAVPSFTNIMATRYILKKGAPMITGAKEFKFSQGQTATIVCEAQCIPKPTKVVWRMVRTGEIISSDNPSRFSIADELTVSGVKSSLSIEDLASNDFDDYNCTVVNERGSDSVIFQLSQIADFPWKYVVIAICVVVVIAIVVAITVCCCRKNKDKTSSTGSSIDQYWLEPKNCASSHDYLGYYPVPLSRRSLSVTSNTTDSSTHKPTDAIDHMDKTSLPDYTLKPVDSWKTNELAHTGYNSHDYPKPELYATFRSSPASTTTFAAPYTAENYGSYRVQKPRENNSPLPYHPATLPIRPSMIQNDVGFNRYGISYGANDEFPEPPLEIRLATNV